MTTVWRANLLPDGVDPEAVFRFCMMRDVVGAGWAVGANAPLDEREYRSLASVVYGPTSITNRGWVVAINAIIGMERGDLCWVKHQRKGDHYIGRIGGTWEYRSTPEYRAVDIVNVRPCFWLGPAEPPPGLTFNFHAVRKAPDRVVAPSIAIYNRLSAITVD